MKVSFFLLLPLLYVSLSVCAQDAAALYQEGLQLKEQKKIVDAIQKFKAATQLKPNYAEALYELGWCRNDIKNYKGAIEALQQVAPIWSTTVKVFFELGYAYEKSNMTDSAIYYYNKCIELKPDYAKVYKQLGTIAYQKSDYTTALNHFANYENTVKTPDTSYLYWYRKGFIYNALKDYAAAKIPLQKSLEFKKDYMNTYLELGFASAKLKEDDQAIDYYKKAIEIDPKSHIGYNGIGEIYRDNKKDRAEAMVWYQKALAINPNERKANFGMGYCYNSTNRYQDAIAHLKKAIEMEKDYTAAYVELGYSYYKIGNNTEAIANFNKALSINPKNENSRYYMGLVYISQKDKANAQRMVDELKSLNSKNAASLQASVDKM